MKKPLRLPSNELREQVEIKLKSIVDYLVQIENKEENLPALFSGNIGVALFLFYYARFTKCEFYNEKAMEFIESSINNIINILNAYKVEINSSYYWESKIGNKINISISHGLSGICIFLSKAYRLNITQSVTKELLTKSIAFLLSQEIQYSHRISMFPSFSLYEEKYYISRMGWCYGDLGIALALWHYADVMEDNIVQQKAIEIIENNKICWEVTMFRCLLICGIQCL
jgi:lantibiotic modifying enzyme